MSLSLLKRFRTSLRRPRLARRKLAPRSLCLGFTAERILLSTGETFDVAPREDGAPEWQPAVEALEKALPSLKGKEAGVVVADRFVRYALLPWSDTLKTHEQWLGLARHRFVAIHGPAANDWEIKFAATAPAGPRLACAIDRGLVDELGARAVAHQVQLVSVVPFLVAAFNRVRDMTGGSCWLVVEEPGRLTLALFLRGVWVAIRSRRADERWRRVLPEILSREAAFLGLEEACTRVIVCAQGSFETEEHESFRLDAIDYQSLAVAGS
ncbi:MAG TPA: hypothetical protein VG873_12415 [Burkholderiales bacterium]|nr:hypothetical protein [Burkholderiales bacterium]